MSVSGLIRLLYIQHTAYALRDILRCYVTIMVRFSQCGSGSKNQLGGYELTSLYYIQQMIYINSAVWTYVLLCYDDHGDLTKVGLGRWVDRVRMDWPHIAYNIWQITYVWKLPRDLCCYAMTNYEYIANFELEVILILHRWEVYKLCQFTAGVIMA